MNHPRVLLGSIVLLLLGALTWSLPATAGAPDGGRVVILGFDGADARSLRELMAANPDDFPNIRKLAAEGTFEPLEVVAPPESPVSWAALNTGQNPAKTGVPGFIKRRLDLSSPSPGFGHIEKFDWSQYRDTRLPLEEINHADLPDTGSSQVAIFGGALVFVVVVLLSMLAFKGGMRMVGVILGVALGGIAAWAGQTWSQGRVVDALPALYPVTKNPNEARNMWDYAADAGVESIVIDAAQAWDMPPPPGAKVLAGLGVPDALGGLGDWAILTTNPDEFNRNGRGTTTAGTVYRVDEYDGVITSKISGPQNFWLIDEKAKIDAELKDPSISMQRSTELSQQYLDLESRFSEGTSVPLEIVPDRANDQARITIAGQEQTVALGEWSAFYELSFELNWMIKVDAITRVRLIKLDPYVEVFVNVLDIDPRNAPFWQPLSYPPGFAAELAADCGLYETYGWPTTTMPVKDGVIDPELLMEDVEFTMKWRERLTQSALGRDDWRLLMAVFSTTDRVQHMMYRFYDEEHPLYDAEAASREMTFFGETIQLRDAVPAIYRQMDRVIGDVVERLAPDDTLLVCSDHGFQSFRRQVNVNNWLAENGFLQLKAGAGYKERRALGFVDWDKTRVYSLGMGFLFLNLEGREPKGIVKPGEVEALISELREKLLAATDPDTGAHFCKEVYVTAEIHDGPFLDRESDLIIGFAPPYRVSWASTGGAFDWNKGEEAPEPVCVDNDSPWSGGHVSLALADVAGVFLSNKKAKLPAEGIRALQIAPTALSLLGVERPSEMDLEALTFE